jgi:hypothetical protein
LAARKADFAVCFFFRNPANEVFGEIKGHGFHAMLAGACDESEPLVLRFGKR